MIPKLGLLEAAEFERNLQNKIYLSMLVETKTFSQLPPPKQAQMVHKESKYPNIRLHKVAGKNAILTKQNLLVYTNRA